MKHYTNKKTNEVFGYESIEDAQQYNDDFENLVEMSDEVFERFKNKPSHFHEWNLDRWIITDEKEAELEREEKEREINELESQLDQVEKRIMRLEPIKQRTDSEEIELDELIDESTELFRRIESLKTLIKDEEKEE